MAKSKNLKAALQSQQSRLKAKEKLSRAAQVAEQKAKKNVRQSKVGKLSESGNGKGKAIAIAPRQITIPFRPTDKILLIGEGNFSFARALVHDAPPELEHLPPKNVTATAYDSEEACYEKYPDAKDIVGLLREKGVEVLFGVDGTRLEKVGSLKGRRWDRVVWNFPHAGKGITDQDRNIFSNQMLILGFLRSAANLLTVGPVPSFTSPKRKKKALDDDDDDDDDIADEGVPAELQEENGFITPRETVPGQTRGTILITLRNVAPYTLWDIPRLAKKPPLLTSGNTPRNPRYTRLRSFAFSRSAWNGYEHRMTKGERAHGTGKTGEGGEDRTWEFCLRDDNSVS